MKILGICGSPRPNKISGTYALLDLILKSSGCEYELISLSILKFSGCTACLECAKDNVCKLNDDLMPLREKILDADAYVIGSPNYFSGLSSLLHCFLERWLQFRHQGASLVWGKVAVAAGVGSVGAVPVTEQIEKFMAYNFIKTIDKISINGSPPCFSCGFGKNCPVGIPSLVGVECPHEIQYILDNQKVREEAVRVGKDLGALLAKGYNRELTAIEMQEFLMTKLKDV